MILELLISVGILLGGLVVLRFVLHKKNKQSFESLKKTLLQIKVSRVNEKTAKVAEYIF